MTIYVEKRQGRPTGSFVVEVVKHGQKLRKRVSTMREAKRLQAVFKSPNYVPRAPDASQGTNAPQSLSEVAREAYVMWKGTKDEKQSLARLDAAVSLLGPTVDIGSLDAARIDSMVTKLANKGLSPKTINRYLASTSKLLKFAKRRGYISGDLPSLPWKPEDEGRIVFISEADETRLLAHLRAKGMDSYALCVEVLLVTGMRVSNLLALKPQDISPDHEWITLGVTKSGKPQTVPIPAALGASLAALVASGLPTYRKLYTAFCGARKALGIDPSIGIHALRHTTATRLTKRKVPTVTVQKLLGHKRITTTLKYAHVEDETLKDAQSLIVREPQARDLRGDLAGQSGVAGDIHSNLNVSNDQRNQQDSGGLGGNRTPVQGFAVDDWWGS